MKKKEVEMPGIEPGAFHMQSERSTTELHPLCSCVSNFISSRDSGCDVSVVPQYRCTVVQKKEEKVPSVLPGPGTVTYILCQVTFINRKVFLSISLVLMIPKTLVKTIITNWWHHRIYRHIIQSYI